MTVDMQSGRGVAYFHRGICCYRYRSFLDFIKRLAFFIGCSLVRIKNSRRRASTSDSSDIYFYQTEAMRFKLCVGKYSRHAAIFAGSCKKVLTIMTTSKGFGIIVDLYTEMKGR